MGDKTSIGWTDSTINLSWGCTKVSSGCKNCYMFRLSERFGKDPEKVVIIVDTYDKFKKKLKGTGKRVFINSMSDTFHETISDEQINEWFTWMFAHPEHQFQILTKRIRRMLEFFKHHDCPANCWLGTSVENVYTAHTRIPILQDINSGCRVRFVSFEPLLEDPTIDGHINLENIQWIIVGGESDYHHPREMNPYWAWRLKLLCEEYDIPFFFKQQGGKGGDNAGGCILLEKEYKEFPDEVEIKA
jgi:protein gp37